MILSQLALASAMLIAAQQAGPPADPAKPGPGEITKQQADSLASTCGARRFETSADVPTNGKVRRTKVTLCAADSDTQAEWVSKLEKAVAQIEAHPTFPDATKQKLAGDLRAEIARVRPRPAFDLAIPAGPASPSVPIAGPPRLPPKSPLAEFNALPPLPRAPAVSAATAKPASAPRRRGPQLTVRCAIAGDYRSQRCGVIAPDDRLVIQATEPFNGPVSLRFTRTDSGTSAEVPFDSRALRAGQTERFSIPKAICRARFRARFELEAVTPVIDGGRSGERLGSFEARCEAG